MKVMAAGMKPGNLVHGRLHVSPFEGRQAGAGFAHAGNLSEHRERKSFATGACRSVLAAKPIRASGFLIHRLARASRGNDGPRQSFPPAVEQVDVIGISEGDAEIAGGARCGNAGRISKTPALLDPCRGRAITLASARR